MEIKQTTHAQRAIDLTGHVERLRKTAIADIHRFANEALEEIRQYSAAAEVIGDESANALYERSLHVLVAQWACPAGASIDGVSVRVPGDMRPIELDQSGLTGARRLAVPPGQYRVWLFVEPVTIPK